MGLSQEATNQERFNTLAVHQIFIHMPGEVLGGVLSSAIPVVGAGISATLERKWALQDQAEQRQYNSPANQLRLLEEAGLPAAAYFASGVGAQSDQPRPTNVDPTLGAADGLQNFFQNRIQSAQIKGIEADARSATAKADLDEADRDFWLRNYYDVTTKEDGTKVIGKTTTPRKEINQSDYDKRVAESKIQQRIASWQERHGDDMNQAELDKLSSEIARIDLDISNQEMIRKFQQAFVKAYESGKLGKMLGALIGQFLLTQSSK